MSSLRVQPPGETNSLDAAADVRSRLQAGALALVDGVPKALGELVAEVWAMMLDPRLSDAVAAELAALAERVNDEIQRYQRDGRAYLTDDMLAGSGFLLILLDRVGFDDVFPDALEAAVTERRFNNQLRRSIAEAPYLSASQRHRLKTGLDYVDGRDWILASDLLLKGVEGAFWNAAEGTGLVDSGLFLTSGRRIKAKGPATLVGEHGFDRLCPSYRQFIRSLFDASGHDLRHGRDRDGHRAKALFAIAALVGWCDRFAATDLRRLLSTQLEGFADAIDVDEIAASRDLQSVSLPT